MGANAGPRKERSVAITQEQITQYAARLEEAGCGAVTIERYRCNLEDLYNALPAGKHMDRATLGK